MEHEPLRPVSASQMRALGEAVTRYTGALLLDEEALGYLAARGIGTEQVLTHRLGVVSEPLAEHGNYVGWLAIPYLTHDDEPVQVRFRCLRNHVCKENYHGKYMTLEGDPARVYQVGSIHRATDEIHVTEGELDAIILNLLGYYAVAIPGAQGFQAHHRRMLAGFSRIYVWGDPDEAGASFAQHITRAMSQAVSVRLEHGDVTDTYIKHGGSAAIKAAHLAA